MTKGDEYTCAICGEVFKTNWTEAEALAELKKTYGDVSVQDCEMVCDECYNSFMSWRRTRKPIREEEGKEGQEGKEGKKEGKK